MSTKYLGYGNILLGVVVVLLAVPLILRRVAMNGVYGVRIPKAFASEQNWYAINHVGGVWLAVAGAAIAALGAFLVARPAGAPAGWLTLAPVGILLLTLVPILLYAARL